MGSGAKNTCWSDVFSGSVKVNTDHGTGRVGTGRVGPGGTGRVGTGSSCDPHGVIFIAVDNLSVFQTLETKVYTGRAGTGPAPAQASKRRFARVEQNGDDHGDDDNESDEDNDKDNKGNEDDEYDEDNEVDEDKERRRDDDDH